MRKYDDFRSLLADFVTEINTVWYFQYDDKSYIEGGCMKAFLYIQKNPHKVPKDRDNWKKFISFILEKNFESFKKELKLRKAKEERRKLSETPLPPPDIKLCSFCDGLGYVWVYSLDHSHDTLMRCDCVNPLDSSYEFDIPQWEPALAQIYRKDKCPLEWFKPDTLGGFSSKEVQEKIYHWRNRRRMAKEFWINKRLEIEKETEERH